MKSYQGDLVTFNAVFCLRVFGFCMFFPCPGLIICMFPVVCLALSRLPLKHGACRTSDDGSSHGRIFFVRTGGNVLDSRAYEHGCLIAPRLVCSIQSFLMGRFFHPRMLPLFQMGKKYKNNAKLFSRSLPCYARNCLGQCLGFETVKRHAIARDFGVRVFSY